MHGRRVHNLRGVDEAPQHIMDGGRNVARTDIGLAGVRLELLDPRFPDVPRREHGS